MNGPKIESQPRSVWTPPLFRPAWWLPGGHLQTLSAAYWTGPQAPEQGISRLITLPDGDCLVAVENCPRNWQPGGPAILMMHGLGGSARNPFLVRSSEKLVAAGVRVFRLNLRGCGAGSGRCRLPYHAGRSDDLRVAVEAVIDWCRSDEVESGGGSPSSDDPPSQAPFLTLFGMSLSGNILLKYLGEQRGTVPPQVRAALAVNPPIDLSRSVRTLERPLNRGYDRHFTQALITHVRHQLSLRSDYAPLPSSVPKSLYDFDDRYTAPHGGYANAEEYYAACSALPKIPSISIPLTILTAADDPLVPVEMFHEQKAGWPQNVQLIVSPSGGHLGYAGQRGMDPDSRWLDWRVVEFATFRH